MRSDDEMFEGVNTVIGEALAPLRDSCEEAVALTDEIEKYESAAKALRSRLHTLRTRIIPDLMTDAGVGDVWSTSDGYVVRRSQIVMGGLPKDEDNVIDDRATPKEIALKEVIRLGGEAIIKNELTASFGKGDNNRAIAAFENLKGMGIDASLEETIHTQTYRAFVKEAVNSGADVDLGKLNCEIMPQVKITPPKGK